MATAEVVYNSNDHRIITNAYQLKPFTRRSVVLSFDDGPSKRLPQILDVLAKENAVAMFFWQSRLLHPQREWQQALKGGHVIGSHSHKHPNFVSLKPWQQEKELTTSIRVLETITKQPIRYFRPPFGQFNETTLNVASRLGLVTVMWDIASFDWALKQKPEQMVSNVMTHIQDGSIILLHELEQTVQVLPTLIRRIKEQGYHFTTL